MAKPGSKRKKRLLFVLEILVLLVFIGVLLVYGQVYTGLDKLNIQEIDTEEGEIVTNEQAPTMTGYTTYAFFGLDHRNYNADYSGENSDTIIICSINNGTKDVKLVSIYRDTLLNTDAVGETYNKANAAYAAGGATQAISMLNTNLDLNITDYVVVDFSAVTKVVDLLGGLDIELSYAEMVHLNNYSIEVSEETGESYTPLELPDTPPEDQEAVYGTYHLNGVQVTSYCRIRYTASLDMGRTERQRKVLQMLMTKAKSAGISALFDIMDEVFPLVTTSISKTEIIQMLPTLLGYSMDETTGFPFEYKFSDLDVGSVIVPTTLATNVTQLHEFLYGETEYTPTDDVQTRSSSITSAAGGEESLTDTQTATDDTDDSSYYDSSYDDDNYYDSSYDDDDSYYDSSYDDDDSYYDSSYDDDSYYDDSYYDDSYDDSFSGGPDF
ncbi:MAG: LCP family protein [Clostridiales bacterium]|nr:LCP family protein [Clostridiales bacterium]